MKCVDKRELQLYSFIVFLPDNHIIIIIAKILTDFPLNPGITTKKDNANILPAKMMPASTMSARKGDTPGL